MLLNSKQQSLLHSIWLLRLEIQTEECIQEYHTTANCYQHTHHKQKKKTSGMLMPVNTPEWQAFEAPEEEKYDSKERL